MTLYIGSFNPFTVCHALEAVFTYHIFESLVSINPVATAPGKNLLPLQDRINIILANLEHGSFENTFFVEPQESELSRRVLVTILGIPELYEKYTDYDLSDFEFYQLLGYDVFESLSTDEHFLASMLCSDLIVTGTGKKSEEQSKFSSDDSIDLFFEMLEIMKQTKDTKHRLYFAPIPGIEEFYFDDLPINIQIKMDYEEIEKDKWPLPDYKQYVIRKVWKNRDTGKYIFYTNYARFGIRSSFIREIAESFQLQQTGLIDPTGCNPFELIRAFMTNDKATKLYLDAMGIKY